MASNACSGQGHAVHRHAASQSGHPTPHEIFSSLWNYGGGELFSALFAGTPSDACQHAAHVSMHVDVQDLCQYWDHNPDLEQAIREYWAEQGVEPVDEVRASCVPLRLYGDGAEVMSAGLRHFVW